MLGLTFAAVGLLTDTLYALLSGTLGGWFKGRGATVRRWECYVAGSTYLALGVASAISGSGKD